MHVVGIDIPKLTALRMRTPSKVNFEHCREHCAEDPDCTGFTFLLNEDADQAGNGLCMSSDINDSGETSTSTLYVHKYTLPSNSAAHCP